ncbi:MAG: DUF512 domain-containing protein [Clostridia bacterium]|nr:DUF512 domain-containing protein [Clostridia bacterium]
MIADVAPNSPAWRQGLRPNDALLSINGEALVDLIDYQALSSRRHLVLHVRKADGRDWNVEIVKPAGAPLGLSFGESMALTPRVCKNKCVFCFIDQMPPNCRASLYVKDDDWRLSLMMGNFITMTNMSDEEFARVVRRKVSPLFISVHTTNPDLRVRMMKNPEAAHIMDRLRVLKENSIRFHCQVVLCPGWNDGDALDATLRDLTSLAPAAQSAALVPVGLTKYREGLEPLRPFTKEEAQDALARCRAWQEKCLKELGTRFVFPADELVCIAGEDVPEEAYYESFPQIENGVGLLRQFLSALERESRNNPAAAIPRRVAIPCGTTFAPYLAAWLRRLAPAGVECRVQPIRNRFFGETVTVTGLLTGGDILEQLDVSQADEALLCSVTLREAGDLFLDDMRLTDFERALRVPLRLCENRGDALYRALLGQAPKEQA